MQVIDFQALAREILVDPEKYQTLVANIQGDKREFLRYLKARVGDAILHWRGNSSSSIAAYERLWDQINEDLGGSGAAAPSH